MLSEILRAPRELPWQPNLDKKTAKIAQNFLPRSHIFHGRNVVNGSSDMLPWTLVPIWDMMKKLKQFPLFITNNLQKAYYRNGKDTPTIRIGISSLIGINSFAYKSFSCKVGFSGSAISYMLSEILRDPRELPWQQNLGKISKNCADFSSAQQNRRLFHTNSKVFGVGEFK